MHSTTKYYFQCLTLLATMLAITLGPAATQANGLYFNHNFMLYNKVQGRYCQHNCTSSTPCLTIGGSYSNWCFPKNTTGFPSNAQMCNSAPNYNAWQLIKTSSQYGTNIYSGDEVQLFSLIENAYCLGAFI